MRSSAGWITFGVGLLAFCAGMTMLLTDPTNFPSPCDASKKSDETCVIEGKEDEKENEKCSSVDVSCSSLRLRQTITSLLLYGGGAASIAGVLILILSAIA